MVIFSFIGLENTVHALNRRTHNPEWKITDYCIQAAVLYPEQTTHRAISLCTETGQHWIQNRHYAKTVYWTLFFQGSPSAVIVVKDEQQREASQSACE